MSKLPGEEAARDRAPERQLRPGGGGHRLPERGGRRRRRRPPGAPPQPLPRAAARLPRVGAPVRPDGRPARRPTQTGVPQARPPEVCRRFFFPRTKNRPRFDAVMLFAVRSSGHSVQEDMSIDHIYMSYEFLVGGPS